MKKTTYVSLFLLVIVASFLAGSWFNARTSSSSHTGTARKVLYYVDPMHPAFKSDKPGIAPDCGMELVPVYEDGSMGGAGASGPPGTVTISAEKQQLIGVKLAPVEKGARSYSLRVSGRVVPDETRTYRINATTDVRVRRVFPPTTGSLVKKDEPLAAYYTTGFLAAAGAYLYALDTQDRNRQAADMSRAQVQNLDFQMRQAVGNLTNMGVSDAQIQEMERTRKAGEYIDIRSPSDGIILARNVTLGQYSQVGSELYRIADLSRVWILADVYENEARYLKPSASVRASLPNQDKVFHATVSEIPPQFDPITRTLKVRLEADNPGHLLRPDMFVDLEVPVTRPPALVVPAEAVVDSGVKKVVYVAKGDGVFEPRKIETGWRAGDQVEIVKGLMAGEKIVVSGTFLLDSESRMKAAAAGLYGETAEDPVCGMEVDLAKAKATGHTLTHQGQTYVFCSDDCQTAFTKAPTKYTWKATPGATTEAGRRLGSVQWEEKTSPGATEGTLPSGRKEHVHK